MIKTKQCGWHKCERKGQELPLSDFPRNKNYDGQKHLYCRDCCAQKARAYRQGLRAMRVARKPYEIWRPKADGRQLSLQLGLVLAAIRNGAHSRAEIKKVTHLRMDAVGDSLAELRFTQNVLRSRVVAGDRQFFLAA